MTQTTTTTTAEETIANVLSFFRSLLSLCVFDETSMMYNSRFDLEGIMRFMIK